MKKSQDDLSRRWLVVVIGMLGLYLSLRYTTLLNIFGIDLRSTVTGVSDSIVLSASVIGLFIISGLFLLRVYRSTTLVDSLTTRSETRLFSIGLFVLIILVLGLGKLTYATYTDETRDAVVSNLINSYSLDLYTNNEDIQLLTDSTSLNMLEWAQRLHPPGHYLPAVLLPQSEYSLLFYRLFYFIPTITVFILLLLFVDRFPRGFLYIITLSSLIFSASYLRNYTLIRFGNELIPFFIFGAFTTLIYHVHRGTLSRSFLVWVVALVLFTVALFSKFSVVVGMLAVCGALIIGSLVWRRYDLIALFFFTLSVFVVSLVLYYLAFEGTIMLERHSDWYGSKVLETLRLVARPEVVTDSVHGPPPISRFLTLAPFQFGPILGLSCCYFIYCIKTRRIKLDESTWLIIMFLVLGIVGVVLVHPRTQYIAPLMFGGVFVLGKCFVDTLANETIVKLSIITCLFSASEVLLMSFA